MLFVEKAENIYYNVGKITNYYKNHGTEKAVKSLWELWENGVEKMSKLEATAQKLFAAFLDYLPSIIAAAVILLLGFFAAKLIKKWICHILKKTSIDLMAEKYLGNAASAAVWFVAIIMAADKLGIPVTSVLTLFAAVGAAVALAVKDNLANLASGTVLLFTRPFKAGDTVEVDGNLGIIKEIKVMHTYIDTFDNVQVTIPNTTMMSATIKNFTANEYRRADFDISVSYESNTEEAKEILLETAKNCELIEKEPELPFVFLKSNSESGTVLCLRVWTTNANYWEAQYKMHESIKAALQNGNIEIPYNKLDVHISKK